MPWMLRLEHGWRISMPFTFWVLLLASPYPTIVHEIQKVISEESETSNLGKRRSFADYVIACVGGGSNAIGAFSEYVAEGSRRLG